MNRRTFIGASLAASRFAFAETTDLTGMTVKKARATGYLKPGAGMCGPAQLKRKWRNTFHSTQVFLRSSARSASEASEMKSGLP